jgi:SSS family solute:Na+ symporter
MYAIESWDIIIIATYFSAVILIGLYSLRTQQETPFHYFLSGRTIGWVSIGASIFAANMSVEHFVALMGLGASEGLVIVNLELMMIIPLILLGWWIAPLFIKAGVFTVPEFFGKRFSRGIQLYLSGISVSFYLIAKISISLYVGGLLLNTIFDWNILNSVILILIITGIYTIIGGLNAVIFTSVFQAGIILVGIITLVTVSFLEIGGLSGLQQNLSINHHSLLKPFTNSKLPWTGILFGAPILGFWYWCTDQYIVQKVLSAKSVCTARGGTILAGFLKTLPVIFVVFIGVITALLFPGINGADLLSSLVYSSLIPVGMKGLVIITLLAAIMATLSGTFISASTLITMDFYRTFRPEASDKKLVLVGRLSMISLIILVILFVPLIVLFKLNLYTYLLNLYAYFGPPIAAVFILGLIWKRMNNKSAWWTLLLGGIFGFSKLISETLYLNLDIKHPLLTWINSVNQLHFAIILFIFSIVIAFISSLLTHGGVSAKIRDLMITPTEINSLLNGKRMFENGEKTDRIAWIFSFALFLIIVSFWGIFF